LILAMIPSMLAALGIVREREMGSISNLYVSPAGIGEFLIGKQLPYVAVSFASFLTLALIAVFHFGLGVKGSLVGLLLGGLFYVFAMTAFGMLVSSFLRTQVAALIATAVICQVPAVNFSGFIYPAASLEGSGYLIGHGFPSLYFQNVSLGTFAKGRGLADLALNHLVLFGFGAAFLLAARLSLKKQER
jgi:ribosome-dependent ATPase